MGKTTEYTELTKHQEREYETELEYVLEKQRCKTLLEFAYRDFMGVPSADKYMMLRDAMRLYQNITMNCTWKGVV